MKRTFGAGVAGVVAALLATAPVDAQVAREARPAKPVACRDARGHVTLRLPPCPEIDRPDPPPATPRLPCTLPHADIDRATLREEHFLRRYPDAAAHESARRRDIGEVVARLRGTIARWQDLAQRRRAIDSELEFYRGKPLPTKLRAALDESDAHLTALALAFRTLEDEIVRLQDRSRCQRDTFRGRWEGEPPGSSGCQRGCDAG